MVKLSIFQWLCKPKIAVTILVKYSNTVLVTILTEPDVSLQN